MFLSETSDRNHRRLRPGQEPQSRRSFGHLHIRSRSYLFTSPASEIATKPPAKAAPTARIDPLERETSRSAVMGFLKYALLEDYETAARFARRP